jgi:hypothetical protein
LRNDKGLIVTNLTRVAVAFKKPQTQWLEVQSDAQWHPPFRLRVRDVKEGRTRDSAASTPEAPAQSSTPYAPYPAPNPATQPTLPASMPPPESLPAPPSMPLPASDLPPILTPPPQSSPQSQSQSQSLPPIYSVPASGVRNDTSGQ